MNDASEDLQIQITVYDEDGEEVFNDYTDTPGANLTSTFETKGETYYVKVESRWEDDSEPGNYTMDSKS